MAQYDGSIRINTKIDSKEASAQLMTLENRIVKTADKVASLRSKMDALKDVKIPTQEYKDIESDIAKAEKELQKLIEKQAQMQVEGKDSGSAWDLLNQKIQASKDYISYAQEELQDLVDTGKAFTLGSGTDEYAKLSQQLKYAESDLETLNQRHDELLKKQNKASSGYKKLGTAGKKSFEKINKSVKKTGSFLSTIASRFKGLALSLLIFNQISKAFNAMISGIKEGMKNLAQYSNDTNEALSLLMSRSTYLKNALATAFSPIAEVAAPILAQFISLLAEAATRVSELFSALMGKDTFTKAVEVQQDYAESIGNTSDSIKDAAKEAKKAIAPFDDLRQIQFESEKQEVNTGKNELKPSQMFETVEVSNNAKKMAEKVRETFKSLKDALQGLFEPLRASWEKVGPSLVSSVKNAFNSLKQTASSIGTSFLKAWNDMGYGERIITNLLTGITNLVDTITLLSDRFREAWNSAGIGDEIMKNLLAIVETLSQKFLRASEIIKDWASKIDFSPLLQSFNRVLVAINPIVSKVGDLLLWLLENVLLPIAKWAIEQGLPAAFDLISAALEVFDSVLEALKPLALWLWEEFLQPFGKWAGEIIISAIKKITEKLKAFSDWIDQNKTTVQNMAVVIASFFAAWEFVKFFNGVTQMISLLPSLAMRILTLNGAMSLTTLTLGSIIAAIALLAMNWDKMTPSEKLISGVFLAAAAVAALAVSLGAVSGAAGAMLRAGAIAAAVAAAMVAINAAGRSARVSSSSIGGGMFSSRNARPAMSMLSAIPYTPPALATGTVVPPNREFLATLGDNKREPEVVSPISTMKQAFMEALAESGIAGGGQSDRPIYLQLDGKTLARLMLPYTEAEKTRVGVRMVNQNA